MSSYSYTNVQIFEQLFFSNFFSILIFVLTKWNVDKLALISIPRFPPFSGVAFSRLIGSRWICEVLSSWRNGLVRGRSGGKQEVGGMEIKLWHWYSLIWGTFDFDNESWKWIESRQRLSNDIFKNTIVAEYFKHLRVNCKW